MRALGIEAARRRFLDGGRLDPDGGAVRPVVAASWRRSAESVTPDRWAPCYVGHGVASAAAVEAEAVFAAFVGTDPAPACSLALVGSDGVVRVRRDGDAALAELLDAVSFVPGYRFGEAEVGTTAAALAAREGRAVRVDGAEHLHPELTWLSEAAAPVACGEGGAPDVVVVLSHVSSASSLAPAVAEMLAGRVAEAVDGRRHRAGLAVLEQFGRACASDAEWVLASDGELVLTDPGARRLPDPDQCSLVDLVLAGVVLSAGDEAVRHVDLPSGRCAEVSVAAVVCEGRAVGAVVAGGPVEPGRPSRVSEAARRQGAHVAPTVRRDYAADLRGDRRAERHAEARMRANRELLSPYLRARHEVAASVGRRRHHLLVGEAGSGKRTLALQQFRRAFPLGATRRIDCSRIGDSASAPDPLHGVVEELTERPHLLVLEQLNLLGPVAARRLDESLRTLVVVPSALLVVGCVDSASVDATRPYGLLLRHFHETVRVPALRYRVEELGEIAQSILGSMAGGGSLRLSLQVVRVLEGYAWPGNVRELEDVLRYVATRKPVGVIQPPDLPASCFASRAPRLSMLETAQCDAIIQALYEASGNRYKAAAMLGIARSSLYRKIDAFGISYIG